LKNEHKEWGDFFMNISVSLIFCLIMKFSAFEFVEKPTKSTSILKINARIVTIFVNPNSQEWVTSRSSIRF